MATEIKPMPILTSTLTKAQQEDGFELSMDYYVVYLMRDTKVVAIFPNNELLKVETVREEADHIMNGIQFEKVTPCQYIALKGGK